MVHAVCGWPLFADHSYGYCVQNLKIIEFSCLFTFVHSEDRSKARPCAASSFRMGHPGFAFNLSDYYAYACHSLVSISGYPQLIERVLEI